MLDQIQIALVASAITGLVTSLGTALGMGLVFKGDLIRLDKRQTRAELRLGMTEDGGLTGNGLLGDVSGLHGSVQSLELAQNTTEGRLSALENV